MTRDASEIFDESNKTIMERFEDIRIECYNYLKHDGDKNKARKTVTGAALETNKAHNFVAVDVDINKGYDEEQKEIVRDSILEKLKENDIVVKTASGGLHIYCNIDDAFLPNNRKVGYYKSDDFNIDLIGGVDESKRSLLVLPGSKYRADKKKGTPTLTYEFIKGNYNSVIERSLTDVLNDLEIPATTNETPEIKHIVKEYCGEPSKNHSPNYVPSNNGIEMDDDLIDTILLGLEGIEVHRDAKPITEEATLFTLFQALNSLPKKFIEEAYNFVKECCKLTPNAQKSFDYSRKRYALIKTSPWVLVTIIKYHNRDYYDEELHDKLIKFNRQHVGFRDISFHDDFEFNDIRAKAENDEYNTYEQVIEDLSRVIRFLDNGTYFIKTSHPYNSGGNTTDYWTVDAIPFSAMKENLKKMIWKEGNKNITLKDAFLSAQSRFNIKGLTFISDDKRYFSLYKGLKYDISLYDSDRYNKVSERVKKDPLALIQPFLDFVHDVIADPDIVLAPDEIKPDEIKPDDAHSISYEYILNWISYIVQNPGKKTGIALILKGPQGAGKNMFTNVISRILIGYSEPNIAKLESIAGKFNAAVEGKMLLVLNEMQNSGDDRPANFDTLKSIVTDYVFMLNQKCQVERPAQNVSNLIFVTNNQYPVRLEMGDRRYAVFTCNGRYRNNSEFFNNLASSFTDEFYEALTSFFMNRDISNFNVTGTIPNTVAREELIRASMTTTQQWVCRYYHTLVEKGMKIKDAIIYGPEGIKPKTFRIYFTDICHTKDDNESRYYLRDSYAKIFRRYAEYQNLENEQQHNQHLYDADNYL